MNSIRWYNLIYIYFIVATICITYCVSKMFPNIENTLIIYILLFTPFIISCMFASKTLLLCNKNEELEREVFRTKNKLECTDIPELIKQKKKLNELEINKTLVALNKLNQNEVIRIPRINLGNSVKAFQNSYVYLRLYDFQTLELYDDSKTSVKIKCEKIINKAQ